MLSLFTTDLSSVFFSLIFLLTQASWMEGGDLSQSMEGPCHSPHGGDPVLVTQEVLNECL